MFGMLRSVWPLVVLSALVAAVPMAIGWHNSVANSAITEALSGYVAETTVIELKAERDLLRDRAVRAENANVKLRQSVEVAEREALLAEEAIKEYASETPDPPPACLVDYGLLGRLRSQPRTPL